MLLQTCNLLSFANYLLDAPGASQAADILADVSGEVECPIGEDVNEVAEDVDTEPPSSTQAQPAFPEPTPNPRSSPPKRGGLYRKLKPISSQG